jgi:phospholipid transport system substrate-binding protein
MPRLLNLFLLVFSILLAAPTLGYAADAGGATQAHDQAIQTPAGKFVQDVADRAIMISSDEQMTVEKRNAEFGKILDDSFDLKTISHFVIGRAWNAATPSQQEEYMDLFKKLAIRNYGNRLVLSTGEEFQIVGTRPETDMDTIVLSQILHSDGSQPASMDWRVRQKNGKMNVIDIIIEGVSLSVTQRQEYAAIIQSNGGQIDSLLEKMRDQLKTPVSSASVMK